MAAQNVDDIERTPGPSETSPLLKKQPNVEVRETYESESGPTHSPNFIISLLLIGIFIANADATLVIATCSEIASDFDHLQSAAWISASYTLASVAVQPITGKLSDIYGRKPTVIWSYTIFVIGTFLAGIGQTLWQVLLGRVIAGIGGAGMMVIVTIVITDLVPLIEVASWRAYVNIFGTLGRSLGGPIGGALADAFGWRWSLAGQVPPMILAIILVWWGLPEKSRYTGSFKQIDFLGAGLISASTVSILLAMDLTAHWWAGLLGAAGILLGALFFIVESRVENPVFPPRLLKNRDVVTAYLIQFLQVTAQLGMMFTVPLYFKVTNHSSNTEAGSYLFSAVLGNTVGGLLCGAMIKRTGRYKLLTIIGTLAAVACYVILILRWKGNTGFWESLEITPGGFGTGVASATSFIVLTANLPRTDMAMATSGMYLMSSLGMVLGTTSSNAIQVGSLRALLANKLDPETLQGVLSDVHNIWKLEEPQFSIAIRGFVRSLEYSHVLPLVCSGLAFFISLTIREYPLTPSPIQTPQPNQRFKPTDVPPSPTTTDSGESSSSAPSSSSGYLSD